MKPPLRGLRETAFVFGVFIGTQAIAQTAIPPSSAAFASAAAESDQYEIHASQDALAQSHDPRIRPSPNK
jgi:hypothetical protein